MIKEIKKELLGLQQLSTYTLATKLDISTITADFILGWLDNLPEIKKYHKTIKLLTVKQ